MPLKLLDQCHSCFVTWTDRSKLFSERLLHCCGEFLHHLSLELKTFHAMWIPTDVSLWYYACMSNPWCVYSWTVVELFYPIHISVDSNQIIPINPSSYLHFARLASAKHTRPAMLTISTRPVVCMSRKHMACSGQSGWAWLQWPTLFVTLEGLARRFEHTEVSFSPVLTDLLHLQVVRMPRNRDLTISCWQMIDDRQNQLLHPLGMRGVIIQAFTMSQ